MYADEHLQSYECIKKEGNFAKFTEILQNLIYKY